MKRIVELRKLSFEELLNCPLCHKPYDDVGSISKWRNIGKAKSCSLYYFGNKWDCMLIRCDELTLTIYEHRLSVDEPEYINLPPDITFEQLEKMRMLV